MKSTQFMHEWKGIQQIDLAQTCYVYSYHYHHRHNFCQFWHPSAEEFLSSYFTFFQLEAAV